MDNDDNNGATSDTNKYMYDSIIQPNEEKMDIN